MKSIILILTLAFTSLGFAGESSELLIQARSNMDSGLVGKWCMENTELEYNHDMTLTSAGAIFSFSTMKETKMISASVGTWLTDGASITVEFENEPDGPKAYPYKIYPTGKLEIDLKDGDPIRVYSHCEFMGM